MCNIVCFRDLKEETDKAIALFGNKGCCGGIVVLLKEHNGRILYGYDEQSGEYTAGLC